MNEQNLDKILEDTKTEVFELMKKSIRPEFLNRIDELIMFTPLNSEDVRMIADLQIKQLISQLAENQILLEVSSNALNYIASSAYNPQFGVRPIKRFIQKNILNELSKRILGGKIDKNKSIRADYVNNALQFSN